MEKSVQAKEKGDGMVYKIKDMLITIPSSGRAATVCTHKLFPKKEVRVVLVVPEDQVSEYEKYNKVPVVGVPKNVPQFIATTRQYIMEKFSKDYPYVWQMDDDLTWLIRYDGNKLRKSTKKEVKHMIRTVRKELEDYPIVSISPRLGNNRVKESSQTVTRMMDNYAFNTEIYMKEDINFAPYPSIIGEDFHVTLTYLNKGYENKVLFNYSQSGSVRNAKGGCSDWRDYKVQRKAAFWLAENHPEVSVKIKKTKSWGKLKGTKGQDSYRVDMNVQWRKAYRPRRTATNFFSKK